MIKDIESLLQPTMALVAVISTNTTTSGAIIDTAQSELGLLYTLDVSAYTDGDYELQIFESDDSGMSGATQVVAPKILPTDSGNSITAGAVVAQGGVLGKLGAFGVKRYSQARIVSTSTSTGATIRVQVILKAELSPA